MQDQRTDAPDGVSTGSGEPAADTSCPDCGHEHTYIVDAVRCANCGGTRPFDDDVPERTFEEGRRARTRTITPPYRAACVLHREALAECGIAAGKLNDKAEAGDSNGFTAALRAFDEFRALLDQLPSEPSDDGVTITGDIMTLEGLCTGALAATLRDLGDLANASPSAWVVPTLGRAQELVDLLAEIVAPERQLVPVGGEA
jgi:hypothetical protein